jgi:hypothetical protein
MHLIGRRSFIRGLYLGAGSHLLGAMLRKLLPEARGAAPEKRYIQFLYGNGIQPNRFTTTIRSESDYDLPAIFQPLAAHKKDLTIVAPLLSPVSGLHGNKGMMTGLKGAIPFPANISLDRHIARKIGTGSPFLSTNLAYWCDVRAETVSADGPGMAVPAEWNPIRAHQQLFAGGKPAPSGAGMDDLLADNRSVLDAVAGDVSKVSRRLAGPERERLDLYLTSLRGLEAQLGQLRAIQGSCNVPTPMLDLKVEAQTREDNAGIKKPAQLADFQIGHRVLPDLVKALVDVTFHAQMCGITRVSSFNIAAGDGTTNSPHTYAFISPTARHHTMCHDANTDILTKIDQYVASEMGRLWEKLKLTPDAGGTMADNTLVMYTNIGGGHHGDSATRIAVLFGSLGGAVRSGRYLAGPSGARSTCDLFVSVANAMGAPIDKFGDPIANKQPIVLT